MPPDRWREVREKNPSVTSDLIIEEILIGDKRFAKKQSGEWSVRRAERFTPNDDFDIPWEYGGETVTSFVCLYTGTTPTLDGKILSVYQKIKTIINNAQPGKPVRKVTRTYWFDKQGLLVKLVNDQESSANPGTRLRWVYEDDYDSTIKIEAPIITK